MEIHMIPDYSGKMPDSVRQDLNKMDLDYEYPRGLDLHPKSELHRNLLNKILNCTENAKRVLDGMKPEWKKIEWSLNAYVPLDEAESIQKTKDWRKPVSVVVPMTFASRETFLTYLHSAFNQNPIHKYRGYGDARVATMLLERVIAKQTQWFKEILQLNTMWSDGLTYGIGAANVRWAKHRVKRTITKEVDELLHEALKGTPYKSKIGDIIRYFEDDVAYEGTRLDSIDPYHLLLDPNSTPNDYQNAEFIGWMAKASLYDLMLREADPEERMFNVKAVRMLGERNCVSSRFYDDESGRDTRQKNTGVQFEDNMKTTNPVHLIHMYITLIPKEWGLGDEDTPEIWTFTVAGDEVIIQADLLDLDHGMYPVILCAPNTDGHSVLPISYLATTYGLQQVIDWLTTSRIANVRKCLNNELIVDPARVEMQDVLNPEPGKVIRLKRSSFNGEPIDSYIRQLQIQDVTVGHMNDAGVMIDLLRQANGTTDIAMGNLSAMPERPTAAGIDAAKSGALSRLQRIANIIGIQSMDDLAWMHAYNTIQFMDQPVYADITGRYEQQLRTAYGFTPGSMGDIQVTPFDLSPYFDVEPHDGALPNNENVQAWTQILQTMLAVDGVAQQIVGSSDVMGIFQHWARIAGAGDLNEFVQQGGANVQPQVMPDEQMAQQVQAGNMVPMSEMGMQ